MVENKEGILKKIYKNRKENLKILIRSGKDVYVICIKRI